MTHIDVVVPTYLRREKLKACVDSIEMARQVCDPVRVRLHLYFSRKSDMADAIADQGMKDWIEYHMLRSEFKSSTFWNDHLKRMDADALCYLTDDVVLDPWALMEGWNQMTRFKYDAVVGFKVENALDGQPVRAAFGMIGRDFADRFPERQVFCPEYWCFYLDKELQEYAEEIGRFYFSELARLQHSHPSFTGASPDETHKHHRRNQTADIAVYTERRKRNLLWGRSFALVEGESK